MLWHVRHRNTHAEWSRASDEQLQALRAAFAEQQAALESAIAQRQSSEGLASRLQKEVDRLSAELHETGPASDLQRQFREVCMPRHLSFLAMQRTFSLSFQPSTLSYNFATAKPLQELRCAGPYAESVGLLQVTDLLYQKQTQLEQLAAEKAAQQLSLERELDAAREQAERVTRLVQRPVYAPESAALRPLHEALLHHLCSITRRS